MTFCWKGEGLNTLEMFRTDAGREFVKLVVLSASFSSGGSKPWLFKASPITKAVYCVDESIRGFL